MTSSPRLKAGAPSSRTSGWELPGGCPVSPPSQVRSLALFSVLLALAFALHAIEGMLPPLPVPGARLGLANAVSLLVLWRWGTGAAAAFSAARVTLSGVLAGQLGAPGFWLSAAGAAASVAVMSSARPWALVERRRLVFLSVLGGIAHNLGQLGAFRLLIGHDGASWLLPALVALGAAAGAATGAGAYRVLPAFERVSEGRPAWGRAGRTGVGSSPAATRGPGTLGLAAAAALLMALAVQAGAYRVVAGAAGWRSFATRPVDLVARVQVDGKTVLTLPLGTDRVIGLSAGPVQMVLEVRDGRVRVRESTCPQQVCVHTGWIGRPGQVIVCVPAKMVITVQPAGQALPGGSPGGPPNPYESRDGWPDVDAVTW